MCNTSATDDIEYFFRPYFEDLRLMYNISSTLTLVITKENSINSMTMYMKSAMYRKFNSGSIISINYPFKLNSNTVNAPSIYCVFSHIRNQYYVSNMSILQTFISFFLSYTGILSKIIFTAYIFKVFFLFLLFLSVLFFPCRMVFRVYHFNYYLFINKLKLICQLSRLI